MNYKNLTLSPKFSRMVFLFVATLALSNNVFARPEYPDVLKKMCSEAKRLPPVLTADICSTCHNTDNFSEMIAKKISFLSREIDKFCPTVNKTETLDYQLYDANVRMDCKLCGCLDVSLWL